MDAVATILANLLVSSLATRVAPIPALAVPVNRSTILEPGHSPIGRLGTSRGTTIRSGPPRRPRQIRSSS